MKEQPSLEEKGRSKHDKPKSFCVAKLNILEMTVCQRNEWENSKSLQEKNAVREDFNNLKQVM